RSTITKKTEDTYVGDVCSTDEAGIVLEELTDYHAKILGRREDWPCASELAATAQPSIGAGEEETWSTNSCFYTLDDAGPRGQVIFAFRFPLTFRDSANPLRTVYFTKFAEWMGKARELSGMLQADFHRRLFETFGEGLFGGVTNSFETTILGRAGHSDVIEGRIWMEHCNETEYTATCEWRRLPFTGGPVERIGMTRMQTSSVQILGHGLARPAPWPDDFYEFLVGMKPKRDVAAPLTSLSESLATVETGDPLWSASGRELKPLANREIFSTSLEDSNLVGNLYFGNYSVWQGRLRDKFLYGLDRNCFDASQVGGQLECLFFGTRHLREAMPFDEVEVSMYLSALYKGAADLWFEYHRVDADGGREKLAVGEHRVALVSAEGRATGTIEWPEPARSGFERLIAASAFAEKTRESA
ncbi:MAG: thioesterase family protein, partial [Deltaproteobacteria bacterium]|nr:thioesterase family protein [Deltaproteobacteria bacterium]